MTIDYGSRDMHANLGTIEWGPMRRFEENGAIGLDHGYGNCMLLLGSGVRGREYHGTWPGLGDSRLVDGDLKVNHDNRSVIAEVLQSRMPDVSIPSVFPDFTPEAQGTMRA